MARLQLNKSSLAREADNLNTYMRFLPPLDLKRQQLMTEKAKAVANLKQATRKIEEFRARVGEDLPMLANVQIDLTDLAKLTRVDIGTENVVGTHLPVLKGIEVEVRDYALLARPHWVDTVALFLHDMLELRVSRQIAARRLELLEKAVNTITQRVNLFDKVLIPQARENIKRIRIYLSDEEMSAVVRSKISKRKRAELGAV